jgi:hypothetical protein
MSKFSQILKIAGIIAGVITLGILAGWLGTRSTQPPPRPPENSQKVPEKNVTQTPPPTFYPNGTTETAVVTPTNPPPVGMPLPPTMGNLITNWEDRLNDILGATDQDEAAKAKQLLEMFPRLPEDGQVEVAQHLANLTEDKDFARLGAYLTAPATPEPVVEVLLADTLNRPNSVKLPILLGVAQACPDPKTAGEAREVLALFLDEDYGTDWATWQTKLQQWLTENPD